MTNTTINLGYVYYAQTHQRQEVYLNQTMRNEAIKTIVQIQKIMNNNIMPPPKYEKRCQGCSLYDSPQMYLENQIHQLV